MEVRVAVVMKDIHGFCASRTGSATGDDGLCFILEFGQVLRQFVQGYVDGSFDMTVCELGSGADIQYDGAFLDELSEIDGFDTQYLFEVFEHDYFGV